jgi:ATP-binding cassette subfamily C protein
MAGVSGPPAHRAQQPELHKALSAYRSAFIGVGALSAVLNVLMLSGSFFMLLVYDNVLPSRSGATLVGLLVLVCALYLFQGLLEVLRARILVQVGAALDVTLSPRVYDLISRLSLGARTAEDGLLPLRDMDQLRAFISGQGLLAFFDLPWMVLYLGICFAFHFAIGAVALAGAILLFGLTLLGDRLTRGPIRHAAAKAALRNGMAETNRQNIEVLTALGMRRRLQGAWSQVNRDYLASQQRVSDVAGGLNSITRVLRLALQSLVLAMGAYLVLQDKATGGVIIASSILTSRALAPIELAIANWRGFVSARQSWERLSQLMAKHAPAAALTPLPAPTHSLGVEALSLAPPGAQRLTVQDVSFVLNAGEGLGIVGPSASGKSSLVRGLVGVWRPVRGKVRLDGASLDQWDDERLGRHIGYLPQDVELLSGTVAQNIARFDPDADPDAIFAAAKRTRAHELILRLPEGYETRIGLKGQGLSAGQSQRIALARALFGDPFLVVLDEPDSNLDADGEKALSEAIAGVLARNGVVVVVAHRPSTLAEVNRLLLLNQGRVVESGPKDLILPKILPKPMLRPVTAGGRA